MPLEIIKQKLPWRGQALAKVIRDETCVAALLQEVALTVPEGPVMFGATAGLRTAIEAGEVTQAQVDGFCQCVRTVLGNRGHFSLLSGEEEARAEWSSVSFELEHRFSGLPELARCAGMLSGGGMSSQLALATLGDAPARCFGFRNHVLDPNGLLFRTERGEVREEAALASELSQYAALVSDTLKELPSGLAGTFVVIEWTASYIADPCLPMERRLGLGNERLLTKVEVLHCLDQHLAAEWQACADAKGELPRPSVLALVYGTLVRTMLTMFFCEEAKFFCIEGIDWTLGHYLQTAGKPHSSI